jgi:hypothetical protein
VALSWLSGQGARAPPGRLVGWPRAAVGTLVAVLVLVPRRFAIAPGAAASTGPAEQTGPAAPVPSTGDKSG